MAEGSFAEGDEVVDERGMVGTAVVAGPGEVAGDVAVVGGHHS